MDDHADRRADGKRYGIRDTVIDTDKTDLEIPDIDAIALHNRTKIVCAYVSFFQTTL